jgi:hypothetical protein
MSGPKKTSYEIERQRREELERQRQLRLENQRRINQKILDDLQLKLDNFIKIRKDSIERVNSWIRTSEQENRLNNFRSVQNQINGIENFIVKLNEIEKNLISKEKERERIAEENRILFYENQIIKEKLNSVLEEKEILNEGIKQRVSMFAGMIKDSEDTSLKTKKQIEEFLSKVALIKEEFEKKRNEQEFVKQTIISGFDGGKGSESGGNVTGTIGNTPVKITFDEGNKIIFNIDESKGGCMSTIDKIEKVLAEKGIGLGDIFIQKTGQTVRRASTVTNSNGKVRA